MVDAELLELRARIEALEAALAGQEDPAAGGLPIIGSVVTAGSEGRTWTLRSQEPSFNETEGATVSWAQGGNFYAARVGPGGSVPVGTRLIVVQVGDRYAFQS